MQPTTTIQLLAAALFISLCVWPLIATRMARSARSAGFDEGHQIAREANAERIHLLNIDLADLARKREADRTAHRLERDQLIQDADQRIAAYARRANPFTEQDLSALAGTLKTLELARNTFAGLQALDKQAEAANQLASTRDLHARLQEVLSNQNAEQPATPRRPIKGAPAAVRSLLVYGPQGCGKTRNARAIADALGLTDILDDWHIGMPFPTFNVLVLTYENGPFTGITRHTLSYKRAMQLVEAKRTEVAA
jgi:hypothetical protein